MVTVKANISWYRLIAEGGAIIFSILLAFAIDAWWGRQNAIKQEEAILRGLRADFQVSQAHLESWLAGNHKIRRNTALFLEQVASAERNAWITVSEALILAPIGAPTYDPTMTTLEANLASGKLDLIREPTLRHLLSLWRMQIVDTKEDELLIRQIVIHQLVPILSNQVKLSSSFDKIVDWFLDQPEVELRDQIKLRAEPDLEGVLAERLFYTEFVVEGLTKILETQRQILKILDAALESR
jgi:hypothetical protein